MDSAEVDIVTVPSGSCGRALENRCRYAREVEAAVREPDGVGAEGETGQVSTRPASRRIRSMSRDTPSSGSSDSAIASRTCATVSASDSS